MRDYIAKKLVLKMENKFTTLLQTMTSEKINCSVSTHNVHVYIDNDDFFNFDLYYRNGKLTINYGSYGSFGLDNVHLVNLTHLLSKVLDAFPEFEKLFKSLEK